jgi:hypothetical protein
MAPEGQKPSKWRCRMKLPQEMCSQPIVHKALSRGTIRKAACRLAEITIRKSQVIAIGKLVHGYRAHARMEEPVTACRHGSDVEPNRRYQRLSVFPFY